MDSTTDSSRTPLRTALIWDSGHAPGYYYIYKSRWKKFFIVKQLEGDRTKKNGRTKNKGREIFASLILGTSKYDRVLQREKNYEIFIKTTT